MNYEIKQGDCLEVLKTLPSESVNCCITSPPYWGLRDYGTGEWIGGDPNCSHKRDSKQSELTQTGHRNLEGAVGDGIYKDKCKRCGAERKDRQIGLELTPDNYVQKMVDVFREVRRVLSGDGTLWLNLGDSYSGSGKGPAGNLGGDERHLEEKHTKIIPEGLKQKDLVGIPWRVAFALQADGWYLRQDIIWHKPNPMPESVTDRCTKAHEYIFLMTKSANYHYDVDAIKEMANPDNAKRYEYQFGGHKNELLADTNLGGPPIGYREYDGKRNKRSVWSVNVKPYKEAHFATFPKELIEPCVLAGCPKDGTILDPFGGSGTTAEVAIENGRNALLIELNPEYIELAKIRISNTQTNLFC
jgi:site-specific DNA-methyltransferase (adenine-specific)